MDFHKLARKAQEIYTERGGAEAAKGDTHELEDILKGQRHHYRKKAEQAAKALQRSGRRSQRWKCRKRHPATSGEPAEPPAATDWAPVNRLAVGPTKRAPPDRTVRSGGASSCR